MKIAVSAQGMTLDSPVDPHFGRAKYFVVLDAETGEAAGYDNTVNLNAVQGAGIQSAKTVADLGARTVITGHVGPKAFVALVSAGVGVYSCAGGTVREAFDAFRAGTLAPVVKATGEGHWV